MELRKALSDYTERQFEQFVQEMIDDVGTENYQDELMYHFDLLVGELGGTNLIFYPQPGADDSAEGITKTVKAWCEARSLPGFKSQF